MSCLRIASLLVLGCAATALTGCSANFSPALNEPVTYTIRPIHGTIFGGQQAVTGGHVYLYATGTSGINSASRSVLTSNVEMTSPPPLSGFDGTNYYAVSDSSGNFAISGDYTCSTGESLYLYATGGNSGAGTGPNAHIAMLAALGTCASNSGDLSGQVPSIQVNEISTIATAYALAGFAHTATTIGDGSSATAQNSMANAVANVRNIYDFQGGLPRSSTLGSTASYTGTVPSNKMLWLADILGACVNTDPPDSNGTCANLFAAMPDPQGATTADTAQVALNMAHTQSPSAATINTLTGLIPTQSAFPYTATTYTDLALPVVYTSPLAQPVGIAIDQNGSVWAADYNPSISASTIYKLSPQGAGTSFATHGANDDFFNMAISPKDDTVWLYNTSGDQLDVYSNSGSYSFTANSGGLQVTTSGISFDGNGNAFFGIVNGPHFFFSEDNSAGSNVLTSSTLTSAFAPFVALGSNLNLWLAGYNNNASANVFYLYDSPYSSQTSTFPANGFYNPLVAGSGGAMWYPDPNVSQLDSIASAGAGTACTGGGLNGPQTITVDGAGHLWNGNFQDTSTVPTPYQTISGFNPLNPGSCAALTSSNGISNGVDPSHGAVPSFIAADGSGNVWTIDFGVDNVASPTVNVTFFTQFLGLSVPAVTPINPALVGTLPQ